MKTTSMEMSLVKIQAETPAESQAISGIIDLNFHALPAAVANFHGCRKIGQNYLNWCLIPDGHLTGKCTRKHAQKEGCDCLKPSIQSAIRKWDQLPWNYVFRPARSKP